MPLNHSDIAALMKGMAPVIRDYVEGAVKPLADTVRSLEGRLAAVEGKGVSFEGVHQRGKEYRRGMTVVCSGSLWVATGPTTTTPGKGPEWALAAKRGTDGKDSR